jgi:glycosyltransferase involved in cell wall biosynthesis
MPLRPIRVAVVCDPPEEGWTSMDLAGEMALRHLAEGQGGAVAPERVCPTFRGRLGRWPGLGAGAAVRNVDRLTHRFWDSPRDLARVVRAGGFDLYHLVDHSYSQLVHVLPPGRAVVFCHDLDTFRCLFEPEREPRPAWFRAMTRHILSGLRKAAAVACISAATRDALVSREVVPAERAHVVHLGLRPEFSPAPDPAADAEATRLLGPADPAAPLLLHVGTNIPRKRVDVLLHVAAAVRRSLPGARLVKVGGPLPPGLARRAEALGLAGAVVELPFLDWPTLAAVYRRASLVLLPSEAEGFGLPAAEALACGVPLLASDLPALHEVGGDVPEYRPVGDVASWADAALTLLDLPRTSPDSWLARRASGLARARLFSWPSHADRLVSIYREVLARPGILPLR